MLLLWGKSLLFFYFKKNLRFQRRTKFSLSLKTSKIVRLFRRLQQQKQQRWRQRRRRLRKSPFLFLLFSSFLYSLRVYYTFISILSSFQILFTLSFFLLSSYILCSFTTHVIANKDMLPLNLSWYMENRLVAQYIYVSMYCVLKWESRKQTSKARIQTHTHTNVHIRDTWTHI